MKGIGYAVSALAGAVAGGLAVHFYEKKKLAVAKADIQKETMLFYMDQIQNMAAVQEEPTEPDIPEQKSEPAPEASYEDLVAKYDTVSNDISEGDNQDRRVPYPIPCNQYGTNGYERINLTYYADGVVADEEYNVVAEADIHDFLGGRGFAKMFGDYGEPGVIHIRNDRLETDFEVDQDPRNWRDFKKTLPNFPTGRGPLDDDE